MDLASAKKHLMEVESQQVTSVEVFGTVNKIGLEYTEASATLLSNKEIFITALCMVAYRTIGAKKYVLKQKQNNVETITLSSGETLCIHLTNHPRNRCIVDYPRFFAGDQFGRAYFFFCNCLIEDIKKFMRRNPAELTLQFKNLSSLLKQVSEMKIPEYVDTE